MKKTEKRSCLCYIIQYYSLILKMKKTTKRTTKAKSISLPMATYDKAIKNAKARGFGHSFSAFTAKLIDDDDARLTTESNGRRK